MPQHCHMANQLAGLIPEYQPLQQRLVESAVFRNASGSGKVDQPDSVVRSAKMAMAGSSFCLSACLSPCWLASNFHFA